MITLEQLLDMRRLREAFHSVRSNHGGPGVDGQSIEEWANDAENELHVLQLQLHAGTYRAQPLRRVWLDAEGRKPRALAIPSVRDRVLQSALAQLLSDLLEPGFSDASFAYRRGRSYLHALGRVLRRRQDGYGWTVRADIQDFFDSIQHGLLMQRVRAVAEAEVASLVLAWLSAEIHDVTSSNSWCPTRGLPQGSPLSPCLANLFLDSLDHALEANGWYFCRYADDLVVQCSGARQAAAALMSIERELSNLGLGLNPAKTALLPPEEPFMFLGATVTPEGKLLLAGEATDNLPEVIEREKDACGTSENQDASVTSEIDSEDQGERAPSDGHEPLLRTLYLMEHGTRLSREGERLVVQRGEQHLLEVPGVKLDQIMVFGNVTLTTPAIHYCLEKGLPVMLLSGKGRFFGIIDCLDTRHVSLQQQQFERIGDEAFGLAMAREFVSGKISNSRQVLLRYLRRHAVQACGEKTDRLQALAGDARQADSINTLRGIEGRAARDYFDALKLLLPAKWGFAGRQRRPPPDPVNSLLSYGYTVLYYNAYALLRARGLHPHIGFLHARRAGFPALAADLMEEFRAPVVDAVVLNLVLNERLSPADFNYPSRPEDPCLLSDAARKLLIHELERKLNSSVTHPLSGHRLDYRRAIDQQAIQIASCLRGAAQRYVPFIIRG